MESQVNRSKDDSNQLPKIYSQKRIHSSNDRRYTDQDPALTNRPLSNNGRTRSLRAFTSKTVKNEVTGNVYNKKIQEIQKQSFLVDRQMKNIQEQINQLRQTIGSAKKQHGVSRLNQSTTSYMSKISSRKISLSDNQLIKSQLKSLEAKILNSRNKIDTHLQKNKAIQQEIDAYRKQISTLKNINDQLQSSFKTTSSKYEEQMQLSKRLDAQIADKNDLTHRKKVQNMHKKAQMIKQYDLILKTLDRQLKTEKQGIQQEKSQFYLTDIANPQLVLNQQKNFKSSLKQSRQSASTIKKPRIIQIQQKIKKYEREFKQLEQKLGTQNIEQITKKFTEQYQKNFHQYNFINQTYKQYEEANLEQFNLISKKNDLLKQIQAEKSGSKIKQIYQYKDKIISLKKRKQKIKSDMLLFNKISLQLKVHLAQYLTNQKQQGNQVLNQQLSDRNVAKFLQMIYERHHNQINFFTTEHSKQKRFIKNTSVSVRENVEDLIEEVKKQSEVTKDNRLLNRQQLQKNTIQLRQRKMQGSAINQFKYKNKKQIEKARLINTGKKSGR